MSLSTHVLDMALGLPAVGVPVSLAQAEAADGGWILVHESRTDTDGRIRSMLPADFHAADEPGVFRLRFTTTPYFAVRGEASLYPYIDIIFEMGADAHYHIPLLLTANSYTTYRGS